MVKVIAIANQKGGVAKTTTTHNLGVAMAAAGKRVLLIDLDSQASLTISVGLEPLEVERTIVDVLRKDGTPLMECVQQLSDRLHIVTSIIDLAPMEMELLSRASREKILDRALREARGQYDYILIDCAPVGMVIDAAIIAKSSDAAILVIESGEIKRKLAVEAREKLDAAGCPILGAVLNKVERKRGGYYRKYYEKYESDVNSRQ